MSAFDRFASWASSKVASAWFFAACVVLVVVWLPSFFLFGSVDTWQLVINTVTTIVTFLLVALLQNTQERDARAIQAKLDAQNRALTYLIEEAPGGRSGRAVQVLAELRASTASEEAS